MGSDSIDLPDMAFIPKRTAPYTWRAVVRFVVLLLLVLIVVGVMTDIFSGLPLSLSSRSWSTWLLGILALGTLYLLGEAGGDWIGARDKVTDPLWKRVWHLVVLLGFAVVVGAVAAVVIRMAQ